MAGLQRSVTTFRRSGSSGVVWDEMFLSGDLGRMKKAEKERAAEFRELRHSKTVASMGTMRRSRSTGAGRHAFQARVVSPVIDPPSPVAPRCVCCGFVGKNISAQRAKPRRR